MDKEQEIIKKAINGGYKYGFMDKRCCRRKDFFNPLMWQALKKECNWGYITDMYGKKRPSITKDWKCRALIFFEENLTKGFDSAIDSLYEVIFGKQKMKTIKVIECSCGEDVYENDYGTLGKTDNTELYCINCGKRYGIEELKELEIPTITYTHQECPYADCPKVKYKDCPTHGIEASLSNRHKC